MCICTDVCLCVHAYMYRCLLSCACMSINGQVCAYVCIPMHVLVGHILAHRLTHTLWVLWELTIITQISPFPSWPQFWPTFSGQAFWLMISSQLAVANWLTSAVVSAAHGLKRHRPKCACHTMTSRYKKSELQGQCHIMGSVFHGESFRGQALCPSVLGSPLLPESWEGFSNQLIYALRVYSIYTH